VHIGHDANRAWLGQMRQAFEDLHFEPDEITDAGGDRVVVVCRVVARGKASGVKLDMLTSNVWTVSNGAIVSCITYDHHAEALEAVGLRESAMSQENLDLVERVVAAVNERDVDGYLACCADDIKLRTPWAAVEGVYEGPEAIRRFFADLQDWAPDFRLTIDRVKPIGATRALVFLQASLSGRASGLPAVAMTGGLSDAPAARDLSTATVYDFAGGKVTSIRVFLDRDQALEAAGLPE
jgi:ketosteroid isomerase-like protein